MPRFPEVRIGDILDQTKQKRPDSPVRTADPGTKEMLQRCVEEGCITSYDRYVAQQPQCGFGLTGLCCRICVQGPCRLSSKSEATMKGICGAHDYTIVARNIVRYIASGAASHSNHGWHLARTLLHVAEGKAPDYKIADPDKLRRVARRQGIETEGKSDQELAREVALAALEDFHRMDEDHPCEFLMKTITEGRQAKFKHCNIAPSNIYATVSGLLAQTVMGMDADPVNIIFGGLKTALADYTGMHIATDITDILFGTPRPVASEAALGVIDKDYVVIAIHGHNPVLSEMVVEAARQLEGEAQGVGAKGIKVVGICCTGNELLMREGVALAANTANQELALMTGAIDATIVDVQCIQPGLRALCECLHTRFITTNPMAKIPGSYHFDFREDQALEMAKEMVRIAIQAYQERDASRVHIPAHKSQVIAGWSLEALQDLFAAVNPDRPIGVLTEAILAGEIKGVCLFAGCNNLRTPQDESHLAIMKELAANDVFLIATGCAAGAGAKAGLMTPAAVEAYAGPGLKSFLKRLEEAASPELGLPLVFHMGSCIDNTRVADLWTAMARELGVDVPKVPFVATAPEDMHEKAVAIGAWVVAMGLPTHVGVMPPLEGSPLVYGIVTQIAHDVYGGHFILDVNPATAARKLLESLNYRAWKLRVHRKAAEKYGTPLAVSW